MKKLTISLLLSLFLFTSLSFSQTAPVVGTSSSAVEASASAVPDDFYNGKWVRRCQKGTGGSGCSYFSVELLISGNSGTYTIWPGSSTSDPCDRGTADVKILKRTFEEITFLIEPPDGCRSQGRLRVMLYKKNGNDEVLISPTNSDNKFLKK